MIRLLLHPFTASVIGIALLIAFGSSDFARLWFSTFAAYYASLFALGWRKAPPVLVWIVTINMITIWADIVVMELSVIGAREGELHPLLPEAIFNAGWAMFFVAAGMGLVCRRIGSESYSSLRNVATQRILNYNAFSFFICYMAFWPAMAVVNLASGAVSALTQPAIAFANLKFVLVYLIAARTFAGNASSFWLILVISIELVVGSSGYFSSYKEAFFVVLIALTASDRAIGPRALSIVASGIAVIVYMSIVWSAVKQEFRSEIASSDRLNSISWLADKYFNPAEIDFSAASLKLLDRVAYSKFYAMVIDRDMGAYSGIYLRALGTTLTPRFLFPDKAVLSDSAQTNALLGMDIQSGTSIGIGFIAQAHIDFGFPGMAFPLAALGALIGLMQRYFCSRSGPAFLGEAFACGALFNTLAFAGNIDKQLASLVMLFLVMAISMRLGGPYLLRFGLNRDQSADLGARRLV